MLAILTHGGGGGGMGEDGGEGDEVGGCYGLNLAQAEKGRI